MGTTKPGPKTLEDWQRELSGTGRDELIRLVYVYATALRRLAEHAGDTIETLSSLLEDKRQEVDRAADALRRDLMGKR